jgi:hypothetical protein
VKAAIDPSPLLLGSPILAKFGAARTSGFRRRRI